MKRFIDVFVKSLLGLELKKYAVPQKINPQTEFFTTTENSWLDELAQILPVFAHFWIYFAIFRRNLGKNSGLISYPYPTVIFSRKKFKESKNCTQKIN